MGAGAFGSATDATDHSVAAGFAALSGVGTGQTVTKADTLYLRSNGPLLLQLTCLDGTGTNTPDTPIVVPCAGLFLAEFSSGRELVAIEAKGSAQIEYLASGQL